ncbi:hypothetical protein BAUCODRAFT_141441 [Baudoinia panamericana UAMH 10762]|uniref:Major facilitator superfamily (MFS) profile domain-containing protein n=1 Tax=Baudoinia panamericana (strain UAMH 10762) TaxID=717646 RepID=M2N4W0_BAUPA|nr:uncharacterized protein BAUCODRAFT_141441 [Baudoinia panamericana UAMH 10762]EMC94049.1 hypothetical protein BAUCODRAFT_141441 [Baudoinia panamericana UAMH 10762]
MASKTGVSALNGAALVAAITSACSAGFLLFGYDQGVMSGVVISTFWLEAMGNPSTLLVGTITALYDVGAVAGAIAAAFTAEPLGRKRILLSGTTILTIGTILMGSAYERVQFMIARIITGIGIGYITSVTPVYQSEISKAAQRGWQVCCQLTTMLFGLMLAYWIYTPRWLMRHEASHERGMEVLSRLRGRPVDNPDVQTETHDILEAIRIEAKEEGSWADLFRSNGISADKRFYLACGIQFMQQMSGMKIVTYYAPTLFQSSLGFSTQMAILMGCFLQAWYILASFVTWFTIDRVGRRPLFFSCALGMSAVLIAEAICVAIGGTAASIAAVVFIFLFEAFFTWGWMGCVWVYPPEILPLKIRAKGAALAAAADFLGNFLVVEITPPSLKNIGYKTYIIWAVMNVANAIIVWLFYPETAGIPLEKIDLLFAQTPSLAPAHDELRLQWSVVARAGMEVKKGQTLKPGVAVTDAENLSVKQADSPKDGVSIMHLG